MDYEGYKVAETNVSHLGGSTTRIDTMIGITGRIGATKNGRKITVRFKAKAENKANVVEVEINGKDLYDVNFYRIWGTKLTHISEHNDIYADMLKELFERETKLYLSL